VTVQRISHYEIQSTLGEGAMGRVYLALDDVLDRQVAIKVLAGVSLSDPSFLDRFRREARLAAQLNHPHIARIYEFGEDSGQPFIAMELVEGQTLSQVLSRGPLTVEETCRLGRQMASALTAAHAKGIVHRDIKAGNMMVTNEGNLLVMDFGVARRAGDAQLTTAGSLLGTPNTMAPETINGQEPGPPADLFAAGCVLYEMLAGRPPFRGKDPLTVLFQVLHQEPELLREQRSDVPDDMIAIINGLLVKEPDKRFGPASALVQALGGEITGAYSMGSGAIYATPSGGFQAVSPGGTGPSSVVSTAAMTVASSEIQRGTLAPPLSQKKKIPWIAIGIGAAIVAGASLFLLTRPRVDPAVRRAEAKHLNDDLGAVLTDKLMAEGLEKAPPESLAKARHYFEEAARKDPTFPNPWHNMGDLSIFEGKPEQAETELRRAITIDPHYAVARVALADLQDRLGHKTDAEAQYRQAIHEDSTLISAPNNLAYLLIESGRPMEAVQVLTPALQKWPEQPTLYKNYGLAQFALGNLGEAQRAFDKTLQLDPMNNAAWAGMARIAQQNGNKEEATRIWQKMAAVSDTALAREARENLRVLMFGS